MVGRSTSEDYRTQLHRLLPRGPIWLRDGLTRFCGLIYAIADELSRIHNRALDMIEEADPQTATETLGAWERACGLPIPVGTPPVTDADRRTAIVAHLRMRGGQTPQYFVDMMANLGLTVTITDRLHNLAGYGVDWTHYWIVDCPDSTVRRLHAGDRCGHPLVEYSDTGALTDGVALVYLYERYKPAHTVVIYNYE